MLQYFETLTDDSGNSLLGATCTVTNYPSGTLANIFNTNGTASPVANSTVVADITGQISFYAPDGPYTLTYSYKSTVYKTKSPVQLVDAMEFFTGTDTGAANSYIITDAAFPASLYPDLKQTMLAANSNTGASTLNLNASGDQPIVTAGGTPISAGAIVAGGIYQLQWTGAAWQLLNDFITAAVIGGLLYPQTAVELNAGVTPTNFIYPPYNILRYGGDFTGTTDNTTAMNTAHSTGEVIYYPPGTYQFAGPVSIPAGGIRGESRVTTQFSCIDASSGTTIDCPGVNAYLFTDFQMGTATKSAGAGFAFPGDGASGNTNTETDFDRVTLFGFPIAVSFVQAAFWSIRRCFFATYTIAAIQIADTTNIDGGDNIVGPGCVFQANNNSGIGVNWLSSGGLRVMGNKFLGGASAVAVVPTANGATADIYIHDNSLENLITSGITLNRASGAMTIAGVQIYDNQFLAAGGTNILVDSNASTFLTNLSIRGNTLELAASTNGISIAWANDVVIAGNQIIGSASGFGIIVAATCNGGTIGVNKFSGTFAGRVSNSASGNALFDLYPTQVGSVASGNVGTTYGTLFSATGSVVFPAAYSAGDAGPEVQATITAGTGAVAVLITAVSDTGFDYTVIGAITGQPITFQWIALGNY
jgi:hypothetical protein